MTLQPLTDDELPAAPVPHLIYFDAAVQSAIEGYTLSQLVDAQRQSAERQRLKSEQEAAARIAELEARCSDLRAVLSSCLHPLELYKAYGWSDRNGVIGSVKSALEFTETKT